MTEVILPSEAIWLGARYIQRAEGVTLNIADTGPFTSPTPGTRTYLR